MFAKKTMFYYQTFFSSSNMLFSRLFLANTCHHAHLREKENLFRYRAYFEGNLLHFGRARTDDAKIVRSRDAQCNTKESP